ncbi:hypothetical protein AAG906_009963 [Vitis piasezkii]
MKDVENSSKARQGSKTKETEHLISRCENFAHLISRCENFAHPKTKVRKFHTSFQGVNSSSRVGFSHTKFQGAKFADQGAKISHSRSSKDSPRTSEKPLESRTAISSISAMAKTEEAFPPPHPHRHLNHIKPPWEAQLRHLFRPRPFPHLRGALLSADTPPGGHPRTLCHQPIKPPAKRTKFSGPGEPSHAPQPEPPTEDPRIPVDMPPETVIRRPMIAGPPIEGNLDCRDRSFHSETYFDIEALRQQPELRDSFRLLQRGLLTSVLTRRELPSGMLLIDVESPSEEAPRDFRAHRLSEEPVLRAPPLPRGLLSTNAPAMPAPPELPQDEHASGPAG